MDAGKKVYNRGLTNMSSPEGPPNLNALLEFYKEQCSHGRHTEAQREAVSRLLLTAAAALFAVMGTLNFSILSAPVALLFFALGILGRRFMRIYEEKWKEAEYRRNHYRTEIERVGGITPPSQQTT